jgi:hypothetical protein
MTKLEIVRNKMKMAAYHRTADAIIKSIPPQLLEELTSAQLILVADALHAAHQSGQAAAERDILIEGAIYSPTAGKMLEVSK